MLQWRTANTATSPCCETCSSGKPFPYYSVDFNCCIFVVLSFSTFPDRRSSKGPWDLFTDRCFVSFYSHPLCFFSPPLHIVSCPFTPSVHLCHVHLPPTALALLLPLLSVLPPSPAAHAVPRRTHMQDLKDVTNNVHYENYRSRKLAAVTCNGVDASKARGTLTK